MLRPATAVAGIALLGLLWFGPLPALARHSFPAHMAMHMGVVAVAAPMLAAAIADTALDPARRWPGSWWAAPWWVLFASLVEFLLVWAWHAPALHMLGRSSDMAMVAEQASFLGAGLLLWIPALGQGRTPSRERAAAGALALLLTATHMTLLGVLLAMSGRVLYAHAQHGIADAVFMAQALHDQQIAGVLMLVIGGVSYLVGALLLLQRLLHPQQRREVHG